MTAPALDASYFVERGFDVENVRELTGGVSNVVLEVRHAAGVFVVKRALERLRVATEWLADPRRILRERDALLLLDRVLPGAAPRVLWSDDHHLLFAMTAVDGPTWKQEMMAGRISQAFATQVAAILGETIRRTWLSPELRDTFAARHFFEELRLDPYYRTVAARHPDLASRIHALIEDSCAQPRAFTHGDFSPKNIIVTASGEPVLLDFEVAHYGDPSFDLAFCLNHLSLKWFHLRNHRPSLEASLRAFWQTLSHTMPEELDALERLTLRHLSALMLARVDGKSPVEYLAPPEQVTVRAFSRALILDPPLSWDDYLNRLLTNDQDL
ncbi:MAG: aminoglycoside phosphotransferase family protein [Bryobacteraceae bacterium]|nr:aminoglycoside phosphotransferase family protein [Bryobacteraceae bacterium]